MLFVLTHAERVPEKFLKHMEGQKGLYEIRVEAGNNIFRIFCCFDKREDYRAFQRVSKEDTKDTKKRNSACSKADERIL